MVKLERKTTEESDQEYKCIFCVQLVHQICLSTCLLYHLFLGHLDFIFLLYPTLLLTLIILDQI